MTAIENLSRIELSILKRKRSYLDKRWSDKRVNANYSRIYYIKKGKGFIESFGKRYELKEKRLYLIPPRGDYSYGCDGKLEIWWVHFTATLLAGISLFDYFSYRNEFIPDKLEAVEEKLSHLIECEGSSTICSTLRCNGILLELISSFLPAESCRVKSNYHQKVERFLPVLEYINRNLGNRVGIQKLSEIAGYERSHFTVLFKKLFGLSPRSVSKPATG